MFFIFKVFGCCYYYQHKLIFSVVSYYYVSYYSTACFFIVCWYCVFSHKGFKQHYCFIGFLGLYETAFHVHRVVCSLFIGTYVYFVVSACYGKCGLVSVSEGFFHSHGIVYFGVGYFDTSSSQFVAYAGFLVVKLCAVAHVHELAAPAFTEMSAWRIDSFFRALYYFKQFSHGIIFSYLCYFHTYKISRDRSMDEYYKIIYFGHALSFMV